MRIFYFLVFGISVFSDSPAGNISCFYNKEKQQQKLLLKIQIIARVAWGHA